MLHHSTKLRPHTDHWAVSWSAEKLPNGVGHVVLAQIQDEDSQSRVALTADEADDMADALRHFAETVRAANQ